LGQADWEITATTVYCDAVDDEVTLLVYADGTARCTGRRENAASAGKNKRPNKTNRGCTDAECSTLSRYRDKLLKSQKAP
jgi:hypothetical protein